MRYDCKGNTKKLCFYYSPLKKQLGKLTQKTETYEKFKK